MNARMAFDRESLLPLYRLEIGEAGESCAIHIAERLGMPAHILDRAREVTYAGGAQIPLQGGVARSDGVVNGLPDSILKPEPHETTTPPCGHPSMEGNLNPAILTVTPLPQEPTPEPTAPPRSQRFNIGDSVMVYPKKDQGIVYAKANSKGEIGVQVKGEKRLVPHKRIQLLVAAAELYPADYDFSIIFDSVENRKARHLMGRKHVAGNIVIKQEGQKSD